MRQAVRYSLQAGMQPGCIGGSRRRRVGSFEATCTSIRMERERDCHRLTATVTRYPLVRSFFENLSGNTSVAMENTAPVSKNGSPLAFTDQLIVSKRTPKRKGAGGSVGVTYQKILVK